MMGGGLLIWALLAGVVIAALGGIDRVKELFQQNTSSSAGASMGGPDQRQTPEDIVRERYARGELSREEYLEALETLNR